MSGEGAQPVYADFVDGTDAVTHRVSLQLSRTHLHITLPEGETLYWALEDLRALPDQAYADGLVLSDGHAGTARLVIDNPHVARELRGLAPNLSRSAPVGNWGRIFGWAGGALTSVAVIIFVLVGMIAVVSPTVNVYPTAGNGCNTTTRASICATLRPRRWSRGTVVVNEPPAADFKTPITT